MEGVLSLATIAQRWRLTFVPTYPVIPQPRSPSTQTPHDHAPHPNPLSSTLLRHPTSNFRHPERSEGPL